MVSTFLLQQLIIVFWQSYCKVDRPLEVFKVSRQTETFNCIVPVKCNSTFLPDHDVDEMGAIKLGRGSSSAPSVYLLFFPPENSWSISRRANASYFFFVTFSNAISIAKCWVSRRDEQPDCILSHHMCVCVLRRMFFGIGWILRRATCSSPWPVVYPPQKRKIIDNNYAIGNYYFLAK
jgi:hypothetical protein